MTRLRIGLVSTVGSPVRPDENGSIEALSWLLASELVKLGHQVTTFCVAGSNVPGEVVETLPGGYGRNGAPGNWMLCEWMNLTAAVAQAHRLDVLHSHAYLWSIPLIDLCPIPLVHTLHVVPQVDDAWLWRGRRDALVTAVSASQWADFPDLSPVATILHGVDVNQFTFSPRPSDYVCYLGRFTAAKGPLQAIAVARRLGLRLLMAGPRNEYFERVVAPEVDGRDVEYVGPVNAHGRDRLLGGARALLYPIRYPEAFGLVLVEAMLCGTPVAALGLGAVPEVVRAGVSGYHTHDLSDFPAVVLAALQLDREGVRAEAQARFSSTRMAREYLDLYGRVGQPCDLVTPGSGA